ncbi:MAG TPA: SAM-dependent methyltransferase, partial [Nitrospiria bacterium]
KAVLEETGLGERVRWISGLAAAGEDGGISGCVFSNELFDSFPVRRFIGGRDGINEFFVDWKEDRFVEVRGKPGDSAPGEYFRALGSSLSEGRRADISFSAPEWMSSVGRLVKKGFVVTVDYGYPAEELFSERLKRGTLLCYYRHTANDDPLSRVGEQDITAHVDFSSLARAGQAAGLEVTGFTNQLNFLMGLGVAEDMEGVDPEAPEMQAVKRLLARESMGGVFKVLIQHKGVKPPLLEGLAFRPFKRGVLGI